MVGAGVAVLGALAAFVFLPGADRPGTEAVEPEPRWPVTAPRLSSRSPA